MKTIFLILTLAWPLCAQQASAPQGLIAAAANPLAELKDEVKHVLADGNVPFTEDQERAVVLMMEDRRQASEDLFGDLMNFQAGPTQGQDADRLRSAIEWMREEFLKRLQDYLRPEQVSAWNLYYEATTRRPAQPSEDGRAPAGPARQNQGAQNVDTIHATLPEGLFALGITRPTLKRSFTSKNTFQVADAHSLSLNLGYSTSSKKNQGVGEFALPELASTSKGNSWNVEFVQF